MPSSDKEFRTGNGFVSLPGMSTILFKRLTGVDLSGSWYIN